MSDNYFYRTASVGETVKFPCHTELPQDVNWERFDTPDSGQIYIYLADNGLSHPELYPQITVLDKNYSHSLVISNVTVSDSAYYRCTEDAGGGNQHTFGLTVEGIFFKFGKIFI